MSKILIFLEHKDGKLPKTTLVAINAALRLKASWAKSDLVGVSLGKGAAKAAEDASNYGFAQVLYNEDPRLEKYLGYVYAQVITQILTEHGADTFLTGATTTGKDLAPKIAALIGAGQASDITGINEDRSLRRPMYAGDVFADVEITTANKVVTVRGTAFDPAQKSTKGTVQECALPALELNLGEIVSYQVSGGDRPELTDAEIVVSGGRAMQSSENFTKYIFPLADALGAAVGASRAAVDSGYAPNDWQVGQTGKIVAPNLYLAVGISGAIQHLAGMKDSKTIVAINKDSDAPIFEIADYGLVADLFEAVPQLTEEIKKVKA